MNGLTEEIDRGSAEALPTQEGKRRAARVPSLIEQLGSEDFTTRVRARQELVSICRPAVLQLAEALRDPRARVRQEAARALVAIADRRTAWDLARALTDEDVAVRWTAADALISLRRHGLAPLLSTLVHQPQSIALRETARHVLNRLEFEEYREILDPVRKDLADFTSDEPVHVSAFEALKAIESIG